MDRKELLFILLGVCLLNGLFSPLVFVFWQTAPLWMPGFLLGVPGVVFYVSSLTLATLTASRSTRSKYCSPSCSRRHEGRAHLSVMRSGNGACDRTTGYDQRATVEGQTGPWSRRSDRRCAYGAAPILRKYSPASFEFSATAKRSQRSPASGSLLTPRPSYRATP